MPTRLAAIALLVAAGCGGDAVCGPGDAGAADLVVDIGDGTPLSYGGFNSSPNNDCTPDQRMPTSITIDGVQVGQPGFHITFCVPRPDGVPDGDIDITDDEIIQVIDINARIDADCILTLDRMRPASGTVRFEGYCADGLEPGGYALAVDATVPGTVTCGAGGDSSVDIALSGTVAVESI